MSRFSKTKEGTKTKNLAGGKAYKKSKKFEFVSILLTSFLNEQFYRSSNETVDRIKELVHDLDEKFVAQAAIYARTQFGMRTITHIVASELARYISGKEWAKKFYNNIIYRPDDIIEIVAYHQENNGVLTNAMKKGFAQAFNKFDTYQIGKYQNKNKDYSLVDIVNMVHPVPTEKNKEGLHELVEGTLSAKDTWESELTKAGQEEGKDKGDVWRDLINRNKLGHMAILKNLRNIMEQAPDTLNQALSILTNEDIIKKNLMLPFRYYTAFKEIKKASLEGTQKTIMALSDAAEIAMNNVPSFDGKTLIALDVSGSMTWSGNTGNYTACEIANIFGAMLFKSNNADFLKFHNDAQYVTLNPNDTLLTLVDNMKFDSGGTRISSIFEEANKKYDRIFILSDHQGWLGTELRGSDNTTSALENYKKRTGANPYIYNFDFEGYHSLKIPQDKTLCIAGFSEKVLDIIKLMEKDNQSLFKEIEKKGKIES